MALTKFSTDVANIQKLDDMPNDETGLSPDELKLMFDKAGIDIQAFINNVLTAEIDSIVTTLKGTGWTNQSIMSVLNALITHQSSADHDTRYDARYYKKTYLNDKTGAASIGVDPIDGLNGYNVQAVLSKIKGRFDDIGATNTNVELSNSHFAANGQVYDSIGKRIDSVDSQLSDIANDITSNGEQITSLNLNKAEKSEVQAISEQVENIIAHNGDGTKDSEIIDARAGEISLGARLSTMTSDLVHLKKGEIITNLMLASTNVGYIGTNGTIATTTDTNWVYTNFIEIEPKGTIDCKLVGHPAIGSISFYDVNKTFIASHSASSAYTEYISILSVPSNAHYIRLSYAVNTTNNSHVYQYISIKDSVDEINQNTMDLESKVFTNIDLCKLTNYIGFIGVYGKIQSTTDVNWRYTDYIEVEPNATLNCNIYGHPAVGSICFYDAQKNVIQVISNDRTTSTIIIPDNSVYVRLSFSAYNTSTAYYYVDVNIKIDNIKNLTKDITFPKKMERSYIPPYKIFTVCNDVDTNKRGHNRNYSAAMYLDHLFDGFTRELDIRFNNKSDRVVFESPIVVTDSNEYAPAVTYNNGLNILESTKSIGITGNDIADSSFNVTHVSTLNTITKNITPRVLCIGDSITYGELAQINDDNHSQNWAYHLMCKEFFMKDNIDANGGYDVKFLGHYKKTRTMNYNNNSYPVTTYHEGIRGVSLQSYLNGGVADFKSDSTGKFSVSAWLSKYRTLDDNGNRLVLGAGTGSLITSSNINDIDVCTPTHVLIMLGANGGGTVEEYREFVNIIKAEYPNMIVGVTISDAAGTYFPSLHPNCDENMAMWNITGTQGNRHTQQYTTLQILQNEFCNQLSENRGVYFIPFYFVQPTAESCAMRKVDLPDASIELTSNHQYNSLYGWHPSTHVNGIGHINWGYQLYSWLKYTIAKGLV